MSTPRGKEKKVSLASLWRGSREADVSSQEAADKAARREEIERLVAILREYDITFDDLVKSAPGQWKVRENAKEAAWQITQDREMMAELLQNQVLPLETLMDKVGVDRRALVRHQPYLIAVALILHHNLRHLAPYVLPLARRDKGWLT